MLVEVHKPKMTKEKLYYMTKEWRKDKKNEEEEDFAFFFFIVVIINKKSCGSEGRGVGWIRLNQKFT